MQHVLLASASPRRRQLLKWAGVSFVTFAVDIDESQLPNETAEAYSQRITPAKMQAAIAHLPTLSITNSTAIVITADTYGVLDDTILVKPIDYHAACEMWQQLSDRWHQIYSLVYVSALDFDNVDKQWRLLKQVSTQVSTEVKFRKLTPTDMQRYWQSGEPQDKAAGYAIQGQGAAWVEQIKGSYTNVVGLPVAETIALIAECRQHLLTVEDLKRTP